MQIHELTHQAANDPPTLTEGLFDVARAIFASDPRYKGMSLKDRYRYMTQNSAINRVADNATGAWAGYVARKVGQDPNYLQNKNQYYNDLKLFVQKNMMPPYTPIDQMNNKSQLIQTMNQIVANRADAQGNPNPQAQAGLFQNLVDLAALSMTQTQSQRQQRGGGGGGGGGGPAFTPQAAQQLLTQAMGSNAASVANQVQTAAGTQNVQSTGNAAVDSLLRAFGFTVT